MDNLLWSSRMLACSSTHCPARGSNRKDVYQELFLGRRLMSCFLIPRGRAGAFQMDVLLTLCSFDLEAGKRVLPRGFPVLSPIHFCLCPFSTYFL